MAPLMVFWDLFHAVDLIGQGGYGSVYLARNILNGDQLAIKAEVLPEDSESPGGTLAYEATIYTQLRGVTGIPVLRWHGLETLDNGTRIYSIVMQRVGPTLDLLCRLCRGTLSLRTICMLAEQLITRIEHVHDRGIIIRDVKPSNIALGTHEMANTVYLIDFGLARNYIDPATGEHIPCKERRVAIGTDLFSSVNMQQYRDVSRRDDLESLGYTLLFLLHGSLPWEIDQPRPSDCSLPETDAMKQAPEFDDLVALSGQEFTDFFEHVRSLSFTQRPDYHALRMLFRGRMQAEGWPMDWEFDWSSREAAPHGTLVPGEYRLDEGLVGVAWVKTL
ncbi:kinase-like protein [Trametes coccinea BRFM310]|uniref:Kinase-like protein n=1 Tax=Trametes coccinea (strain BRFM310) TaxID=1353009 RepID=A0A1Y2IIY2_TRAC3|nr:kinase-like protein [Trametes coccinea BRFM310]